MHDIPVVTFRTFLEAGAAPMQLAQARGVALALSLCSAPIAAQVAAPADSAQAAALLREGSFAAAALAYGALTVSEPDNPWHWNGLAHAEHSLGRFARSEAAFSRALVLLPAQPPRLTRIAWYNVAAARARQGKLSEALLALDSATVVPMFTPQMLEGDSDFSALHADPRFLALTQRMIRAASPCETMPKAHEFDFWIGEWEVYAPSGTRAGTSVIQKVSNGCALLENWDGGLGTGKSLNFYNPTAGYWQQTWIGASGGPTEYRDGVLEGRTMRFLARSTSAQGTVLSRLSFTQLGPNRVRQHAENSTDNGASWTTAYDFQYLRKGSGEKP